MADNKVAPADAAVKPKSHFPLLDGEQVMKKWEAPQPKCAILSRDRVSLMKTKNVVAYSAERVQPCCPDNILFSAIFQHFAPESISLVSVSKAPYDPPLLTAAIMLILAAIGAKVLAGEDMPLEAHASSLDMAFLALFIGGLIQLTRFIVKAVNAVCTVEITTSIETHSTWGCFAGTEKLYTSIIPAGMGRLEMGGADDVGLHLLAPEGIIEDQKGTWKVADPKDPNRSETFAVTDKRFVWRKYAKACCMTVNDDLMTINPAMVQSVSLDTAPVSLPGFYGSLCAIVIGAVLAIAGSSMEDENMGMALTVGGGFFAVVGLLTFLGFFCAKPKDILTIYLKTAVFSPLGGGSQMIGPITIPTGKGQEALKAVRDTLRRVNGGDPATA